MTAIPTDPPTTRTTRTTPTAARSAPAPDLPLYRLHLMRGGYLFMAVGLALVKWPLFAEGVHRLPVYEGVVACLLTVMGLLAVLGVRYPVRLLPLLVFESAWKLLWLGTVALPLAVGGDLEAGTREVLFNCSFVVVILAVTPWDHVWRTYVRAPGDRWR